jgi:hypothetical protein
MKNQPKALLFGTCLTVAGLMLSPGRGMAQNVQISNGGSYAIINPGNGTGTVGMNDWSVGNNNVMQNELAQQWFWYQIGSGTVYSIDNLTMSAPIVSSADGGANNEVTLTYSSAQLSIQIVYELLGSGMNSGTANIQEGITLTGTGLSQNVNLFQYSNFNLLQNNANTLQVFPDGVGGWAGAQQNASSGSAVGIAEGISAPDASNAQAGLAAAVLGAVESGTLNGNSLQDPTDDVTLTAGPGNVAWAFEWTAVDGNLNIAKQKQLSVTGVPEPTTLALIGLGLGAVGLVRRRRSS